MPASTCNPDRVTVAAVFLLLITSATVGGFAASNGTAGKARSISTGPIAFSDDENDTVDYLRDIEPLFRQRCYSCHGSETEESGLRLDVRQRAMEGGDGGKIIEPGQPEASRLLNIVRGQDDLVEQMPPEGEGTPLSESEVDRIRAWIADGAIWPDHTDGGRSEPSLWSLAPLERPDVPSVDDDGWAQSPIDRFVLAVLHRENVAPAPRADRATLIRRLYLDLLGLPPSVEDVDRFIGDPRPDAYERLVDRLMASAHFGERWGRHWLDLARYADSDGYEKDNQRPHAWRYRQWVIDALNADLPYDQFSTLQLAGDLTDAADSDGVPAALGFHRNTLHNTEGGIDPEEDRVKKTVDRTNTFVTIWLGLTVGCAQCHSHKYDPLTQREYFSLYDLFNHLDEADVVAPTAYDLRLFEAELHQFERRRSELVERIAQYDATERLSFQHRWEQEIASSGPTWTPWTSLDAVSKHGASMTPLDDGSILVSGVNERSDIYTVTGPAPLNAITAMRLEVLPHESLVNGGPGRASNGNFVISTITLQAIDGQGEAQSAVPTFARASADFSQGGWEVANAINAQPSDGWAVGPEIGKRHVAVFELAEPFPIAGGRLLIVLDQTYANNPHNLGCFRISWSDRSPPFSLDSPSQALVDAASLDPSQRTPQQQAELDQAFRETDPTLASMHAELSQWDQQRPQRDQFLVQSVRERPSRRETRIHIRGDFLNPGLQVQPGIPAVLPPLFPRGETADRLDLARWTFADANPLTARVAANRIWALLFGRGIVASVDDFGTQGEPPTHPGLLDWLACELRDGGWSQKALIRTIVLSETYRQASAYRPELAQRDPQNRWLARQQRLRVEAEIVRDLALATAGILDASIGGPSIRPPQPADYEGLTYANSAKWPVSEGGDRYRRGCYIFFQRTSPYPMLATFDCPDSNATAASRPASNTAIQSLTLWNDPVFFECAQQFGRRIALLDPWVAGGDPSGDPLTGRLRWAFRRGVTRQPDPVELQALRELFEAGRRMLADDQPLAIELAGPSVDFTDRSPEELAAWVLVARTILNLDSFIVRE